MLFLGPVLSKRSKRHASIAVPDDSFVVAGYLPEYRLYVDLEYAGQHLTDLLLFSAEPKADGDVKLHWGDLDIRRAMALKRRNPKLRLHLTLGGGGRSSYFPNICTDSGLRRRLVNRLASLVQMYGRSGINFDWEVPQTPSQVGGYVRLLHEAHALLPSDLIVSVALHPGQNLGGAGYGSVDMVMLMAYDMSFGKGGVGHSDMDLMNRAVKELIKEGVPKEKIILGVPGYGRREGEVKSYAELIDDQAKQHTGEYENDFDKKPHSELLPAGFKLRSEMKGFMFDSLMTAQRKTAFAKMRGLGGVFLWEVGQDKFVPGVSLIEGMMLVGNGSKKLSQAEMTIGGGRSDKSNFKTAEHEEVGSRKQRRRREREEREKRARARGGGDGEL